MLIKRGVEVSVFIEYDGSERDSCPLEIRLNVLGATMVDSVEDKYDHIHIHYESLGKYVEGFKAKTKFFVHGLMTEDYKPVRKYDEVFVFSERANDFIDCDTILIRNYIDLDRFKFIGCSDRLRTILILDSRTGSALTPSVMLAAQRFRAFVQVIDGDPSGVGLSWDIENVIRDADMVVGYGRSAYEAMAMGKSVLVYGTNGGDGLIKHTNFEKMMTANTSGWAMRAIPSPVARPVEHIVNEMDKYSSSDGTVNRQLAKKYLDMELYAERIIT